MVLTSCYQVHFIMLLSPFFTLQKSTLKVEELVHGHLIN